MPLQSVIIFLMLLCALGYLQFYHDKIQSRSAFYLSPLLLINISWILYGLVPLLFLDNHEYALTFGKINYPLVITASIVFWGAGFFVGIATLNSIKSAFNTKCIQSDSITAAATSYLIVIVFFMMYYIYKLYGGPFQYFTQQYGSFNVEGISSLVSSLPFVVSGIIFYLISFRRSKLIVGFSVVIAVLFALGGNRNIFSYIIIGMLYSIYRNKNIRVSLIIIFIIAVIFSASFLAVAREFGVGTVITGGETEFSMWEVLEFTKRYNEGEFGTMYRTIGYFSEKGSDFNYFFSSFSYLFSPIINLIPTSIFPERPNTIAAEFTFHYWGGKSDFLEGLGFSPIVEGLANFGSIFFVMPIFCMAIIITMISKHSIKINVEQNQYWQLFTTCVAAASLNFFRIDFAIYTKFIFISFISAIISLKFSKLRFKL